MQLIPIGNSIVYVRPFYAQGSGEGSYPLFQFVVVFSQDARRVLRPERAGRARPDARPDPATRAACRPANAGTNGTAPTTTPPRRRAPPPPRPPPRRPATTTIPPAAGSAQELLHQAAQDLDDAQTALEAGNLGQYQRLVNDARHQGEAGPGQGWRLAPTLSAPGWGSPPGLLLWA